MCIRPLLATRVSVQICEICGRLGIMIKQYLEECNEEESVRFV